MEMGPLTGSGAFLMTLELWLSPCQATVVPNSQRFLVRRTLQVFLRPLTWPSSEWVSGAWLLARLGL